MSDGKPLSTLSELQLLFEEMRTIKAIGSYSNILKISKEYLDLIQKELEKRRLVREELEKTEKPLLSQ
jgi:hypothetical protein